MSLSSPPAGETPRWADTMSAKQFNIFLTLSWVVSFAGLSIAIATESALPPELRQYHTSIVVQSLSAKDSFIISGSIVLILGMIVSYIGLYLRKNWSRILFISIIVFSYFVTIYDNTPIVYPVWADIFFSLGTIFIGIVIAAMYFCPEVKEKFQMK